MEDGYRTRGVPLSSYMFTTKCPRRWTLISDYGVYGRVRVHGDCLLNVFDNVASLTLPGTFIGEITCLMTRVYIY